VDASARARFAFPAMDEYSRHLLQEHRDADTVHLEAHLPGAVDGIRIATAFAEVLADRPRLLVRQSPARWWHRRYHWEPAAPGPGAVRTGDDLGRARHRALSEPPPLGAGPPLRLEAVALPDGGTALVLTAAHTLADAGTCLRLLCDLADHYAAPAPALAPAVAPAPVPARGPGPTPGARAVRRGGPPIAPAGAVRRAARRPARIALAPGPAPGTGTGLYLTAVPVPGTSVPRASGPSPFTVNDLLLTAVQLGITAWNRQHGRPDGPVVLSMPVDDRPEGPLAAAAPMGNHNHLATVHGAVPSPDVLSALAGTAAQTRAAKAAPAAGPGPVAALVSTGWLPVGAKAPLTRALRRATAPWTSTALVSNLGRVGHPLDFGPAGRATALWFSAPVRMPRGLSVGAVTIDSRLHLAFRYCRALLDREAAAGLAERCLEALELLVKAAGEERA